MSDWVVKALRDIARGKQPPRAQLMELERDGHITVDQDGFIHFPPETITMLNMETNP